MTDPYRTSEARDRRTGAECCAGVQLHTDDCPTWQALRSKYRCSADAIPPCPQCGQARGYTGKKRWVCVNEWCGNHSVHRAPGPKPEPRTETPQLVADRDGVNHDPAEVADRLDAIADRSDAATGEALHDAADVVRALAAQRRPTPKRAHPTYSLTAHGTGEARAEFDGREMRLRIGDGPWQTIAIPERR